VLFTDDIPPFIKLQLHSTYSLAKLSTIINYPSGYKLRVDLKNISSFYNQENIVRFLKSVPKIIGFEAAIWIGALLYLTFIHNPGETHFTICPIKNIGLDFCPGCGLGNSISYILHGDIFKSLLSHPLGLFALLVLILRIFHLIKNNWSSYGKYSTANALP